MSTRSDAENQTASAAARIGIVGLGLIGGSVARGLRESGFTRHIVAWDHSPNALLQGVKQGVVDKAADSLEALVGDVSIVVLAAPGGACEALLPKLLKLADGDVCVTDVASVKGSLVRIAEQLPASLSARFVPGHPIAGSERSGVGAARGDLFRDHRVILTPLQNTHPRALRQAEELWQALGARVAHMSWQEHDAVLAATSHLPHMLAYALVAALARSSTRDDIFRYAAGGFRDFTRIASSSPIMWRDIALTNREPLLESIDTFTAQLNELRAAVQAGEGHVLQDMFVCAKAARDELLDGVETADNDQTTNNKGSG